VITNDAKWLGFFKYPTAADAKKLKKDRKPVQSGVVLLNLATGETREFDKVRRFSFAPKQANWVALQRYAADGAPAGAGADLLLVDVRNGTVTSIGNVGEFASTRMVGGSRGTIEGRDPSSGNGVQVPRAANRRVARADKATRRSTADWRGRTAGSRSPGSCGASARGSAGPPTRRSSCFGYYGICGAVKSVHYYRRPDTSGFPERPSHHRGPRPALGPRIDPPSTSAVRLGAWCPRARRHVPDVRPAAGIPGRMQATARGNPDDDELASP
jgi:hypothetical protein